MKTHTLEAGQFVEFILTRERNETYNDDVNCGNTNLNEAMNRRSGNCTATIISSFKFSHLYYLCACAEEHDLVTFVRKPHTHVVGIT